MGTGSSSNTRKRQETLQLLPALDPLRRQPYPAQSKEEVIKYMQPLELSPVPVEKSKAPDKPTWPLPPSERAKKFELPWRDNLERYSLEAMYQLKMAPESNHVRMKQKLDAITSSNIGQYHQEERVTNQWKEEVNSSVYNSAHVQSKINAQSQTYVNVSGTSEMIRAISIRNDIQKRMNQRIADRTELLSKEAQFIIESITVDTNDIEKNLLAYAKERQLRQDELYREWLQKYVAELDTWKSQQMSKLQEELEKYHKEILAYSQLLIDKIYHDEDKIKLHILKEEQEQASFEIKSLMAQIESSSEHQLLQNVGSEIITNINLTIHSGVGKVLPRHSTSPTANRTGIKKKP